MTAFKLLVMFVDHFKSSPSFLQSGEKKKDDETVDSLGKDLSVWTFKENLKYFSYSLTLTFFGVF